jgi:hypothetical protein
MTRPCSHHRFNSTALLPEFGGMGAGATDSIRLLMRKLTLDRIRLSLAAFVRERWRGSQATPSSRLNSVDLTFQVKNLARANFR